VIRKEESMSRSTAALAVMFLALSAGWQAAAAPQPPPPDASAPCPVELGAQATINVDENAAADPDCLRIKKGKTRVVWKGTAAVTSLLIEFKPAADNKSPDNPACAGAQCVLEKAKHAAKEGEFAYTVVVMRKDGTTATVDPKLIIEPVAP
jgi:hypothetical protein